MNLATQRNHQSVLYAADFLPRKIWNNRCILINQTLSIDGIPNKVRQDKSLFLIKDLQITSELGSHCNKGGDHLLSGAPHAGLPLKILLRKPLQPINIYGD
ncbi:hypothetical protein EVAR_96143_1 [Eumeta japonica]|uniref:Uncharacterized protein n=1 Tax=Eumeta variegata TaxID=151549 RepID=A0A4C1VJ32_EUMVA|nr:hypothetical protein EVAR_96143_1 [Eumeta japonica]